MSEIDLVKIAEKVASMQAPRTEMEMTWFGVLVVVLIVVAGLAYRGVVALRRAFGEANHQLIETLRAQSTAGHSMVREVTAAISEFTNAVSDVGGKVDGVRGQVDQLDRAIRDRWPSQASPGAR